MRSQDDMDLMFDELTELQPNQRAFIKHRYRFLMEEYRKRAFAHSILFYVMRTTITAGSLAVPALLSLQSADIYWFTWALSLAVTTANGITTLFKLETKFFLLHTTMEQIRSETWQFLELSGRYSGHHGNITPSHRNQYMYYCSRIEKIRMRHIGVEYSKHGEQSESQQGQPNQNSATVVPSPPDQAIQIAVRRDSIRTVGDESNDGKENEKKPEVSLR